MSTRPTLGMIGCGYWGPNLLRNYAALDEITLKTVADRAPERRKWVEKQFPKVRLADDGAEILNDPEITAVVIATPAGSHGALVEQALLAGKDVFVEKPLSLDTREAAELARLADAEKRVLMVGHTFLFNAAVRDLKRRIDAGELGKLHYLYSQRLNLGIVRDDVNASWNLAPHDVSIGRYLLGSEPVEVSANGVRALQPEAKLDDVVFLSIRFASGVVMHVHVSWLDPRKVRTMTVVGDKKMIVYDDVSEDKLLIYDKGITRGDPVPVEQPTNFARFKMITRAGDLTIPNLRVPEPLAEECRHFAKCLVTRERPLTDGWSGVAVTAVLEAADRSLQRGGAPERVEVPTS
ncbi:Gfo/Idh/MocA family oxidoreductase [Myxococcota bacterium]|nr:Gfo/Idh/MocA family oxidoreductase [Myxococcota bacterium]